MRNQKGFTMVETLIVMVIAVVIASGLMLVLSGGRRTSRIAELDAQAQQNARVAVDVLVRDLRSNGYNIDVASGQRTLVHAGPYDVVFNANIEPEPDNAATPGYPAAMSTGAYPSRVPPGGAVLYAPTVTYATGAETIRFSLDSNNDGMINDGDRDDDVIEQTANPMDYALIRQVYGFDGSSNGGANEEIALLRGPGAYSNGGYPDPLFTYWYDHDDDESTPDRLWGDISGNGHLESGEIAGLIPVSVVDLGRVTRIHITAIGTARAKDMRHDRNEGFRETVISSEVTVTRSRAVRAAYIRGIVFDDLNGDGSQGSGENGMSGVLVYLNNGARDITNAAGHYVIRVDPGSYTVNESDPRGYTSTTPNSVVVTATKGSISVANFGDRAMGGYGSILGKVFLWVDEEGELKETEIGVPDVEVYLNSGERDTTDMNGGFGFLVPVSSYSVTMVVPEGFAAVGPVTVDKTLGAEGDTVLAFFGLREAGATGTIRGTVFLDDNEDGVFDLGEPGIPSVAVKLSSGDSTLTDADGKYSFTVQPGTYDVIEEDLGGFMSTTINNVTDVLVSPDTTVIVNFGDILATELSFTVISLGETQRALCITSTDLGEDSRGDKEIILGTKYVAGVTNLNVWFNEWKNSSTPNSAIFNQDPSYSRTPNEDILSVSSGDLNGDDVSDVVTGLTEASGKVLVWLTQTSGSNKGMLPDVPDNFIISTSIADVYSTKIVRADAGDNLDVFIGTQYTYPLGLLEVWFGDGLGGFSHGNEDVYDYAGATLLNSVRSLDVGNLVNSPARDVVVGTKSGDGSGTIEVFRDNGSPNGKFAYYMRLNPLGEVNAIAVMDMKEDSNGDVDIIVGTRTGVGTGTVEIWHNNGNGTFGLDDGFGEYRPSDKVELNGEVLSIYVENFNGDVYPDIVAGLKHGGAYSGEVKIFPCYGFMPSAGGEWTSPNIGEAITLTINDFNKDWKPDLAVGTRTSLSQGKVVVFFND